MKSMNSAAYSAALKCSGSMFLCPGKKGQTYAVKINLPDHCMMKKIWNSKYLCHSVAVVLCRVMH